VSTGIVATTGIHTRIAKMIENDLQEIRVYDQSRDPRNWNELLGPTQCAVFLKDINSEVPLSPQGVRLAYRDSTFLFFDRLELARAFCEEAVEQHPEMCCEIFDSEGKAKAPILTIVHTDAKDELSAAKVRKRRIIAIALFISAIPLNWWDWHTGNGRIYPTMIGINMILVGIRLMQWNAARGTAPLGRDRASSRAFSQREIYRLTSNLKCNAGILLPG
jgi:hypothetical protein